MAWRPSCGAWVTCLLWRRLTFPTMACLVYDGKSKHLPTPSSTAVFQSLPDPRWPLRYSQCWMGDLCHDVVESYAHLLRHSLRLVCLITGSNVLGGFYDSNHLMVDAFSQSRYVLSSLYAQRIPPPPLHTLANMCVRRSTGPSTHERWCTLTFPTWGLGARAPLQWQT